MELSRQIGAQTEDIEELRSEKTMMLGLFDKSDDAGMKEIRQWVTPMETSLQRLEQQETRFWMRLWRNTAICRIRRPIWTPIN
jgi:hypothetical protein